jgi:copper homeostasis protein
MAVTVEICTTSLASALAAQEGGADRVELCGDGAEGGTTPDEATLAAACRSLRIPVHVLIRPRGGDFVYSFEEISAMHQQVEAAKALGASGVVIGMLTAEEKVDLVATAALAAHARPMAVTFHRAFDAVRDPFEAIEDLILLGWIGRVLTSGGRTSAHEGTAVLSDLVRQARGRIAIMAGGGIVLDDLRPLIAEAKVREVHLGTGVGVDGDRPGTSRWTMPRADPEKVRKVVEAVRSLGV